MPPAILAFGVIALSLLGGGGWHIPVQSFSSVVAAVALLSGFYRKDNTAPAAPPLNAAAAAFFVFILYIWLRTIASDGVLFWRGFEFASNWTAYLAVYLSASVFTQRNREMFFSALLKTGAVLAVVFFVQRMSGADGWATLPKKSVFAAAVLSSAVASFAAEKKRFEVLETAAAAICFLAALFAMSISVWLGILAAAAALASSFCPARSKRLCLAVLGAAALSAVALKLFLDVLAADRLAWYVAALRMFAENPVFGFGPGSFAEISARFTTAGLKSVFAHSVYLELLAETGAVGLVIFGVLLYFLFSRASHKPSKAAMFLLAVAAATDFIFNFPSVPLIFFAAAGAGASPPAGEMSGVKTGFSGGRLPRIFSLAAGFAPAVLALFLTVVSAVKYDIWRRLHAAETAALAGRYDEALRSADGLRVYGRLGGSAFLTIKNTVKQ